MKTKNNFKRESSLPWLSHILSFKTVLLIAILLMGIQMTVQAQEEAKFTRPSWWFGAAAGANFNFYRGSTQTLNRATVLPVVFQDGDGVGVFAAGLLEYHRPETMLGFMLMAGYDSREGSFDQEIGACGCVLDLYANLAYFTVEPSIRFAPFKSNLYLFGGPRFAFNVSNKFVFEQDQFPNNNVSVDFGDVDYSIISMQVGIGYDIPISSQNRKTQFVISPFVSFHPYFGQDPRTVETWNVTTLRTGVALKFGVGKKSNTIVVVDEPQKNVGDMFNFSVNAPKNIPAERTVLETFPVLNYVFFDLGSTEIPNRYVLLEKSQVQEFKEENVALFTPANLSGRAKRQMVVYYNMLNILGDRMVKNPSSTIKLVGSSEKDPADARILSESVKTYLETVWAIDGSRITTEGRDKPKIPSEQKGATNDLVLLREGDRRVSIESNSPELLMEFQSGPDAPLKPIQIVDVQEAPIDSYVTFNNDGASEVFTSWSIETKDEQGKVQYFGPYTQDVVAVPGKSILGTRPEGKFNVKMTGTTKDGVKVVKEAKANMVLWTPAK